MEIPNSAGFRNRKFRDQPNPGAKTMLKLDRACALIFLTATLGDASAATLCVDPADGSCFETIQDAIDSAFSGDVILVKANPDSRGYRENLSITTPGLTLRGDTIAPSANITGQQCPDVVLDSCQTPESPNSCGSTIATISAPDTRIERLLVRHGSRQRRLQRWRTMYSWWRFRCDKNAWRRCK